jgi:hypothetical protein
MGEVEVIALNGVRYAFTEFDSRVLEELSDNRTH